MSQTLWRLNNPIKSYAWGSLNEISERFQIQHDKNEPMAEVWMGAHPEGVSITIAENGETMSLDRLIAQDPQRTLGSRLAAKRHTLPFLFKILSAQTPLSIQVHPKLEQAQAGFDAENRAQIARTSPQRLYKDDNHKPELVYAITPFYALNGFRPCEAIVAQFQLLDCDLFAEATAALATASEAGLSSFFNRILTLNTEQKQQAIAAVLSKKEAFDDLTQWAIDKIYASYPDDIGILAPLMLHVILLHPGEAMFLRAGTPHAYLFGTALEIMASSDNVLRAGLTPKHIDIPELIKNTEFRSLPLDQRLTPPKQEQNEIAFEVPIPDFKFSVITSHEQATTITVTGPEILLCLSGSIQIETDHQATMTLSVGQTLFVEAATQRYSLIGHGEIARAYC